MSTPATTALAFPILEAPPEAPDSHLALGAPITLVNSNGLPSPTQPPKAIEFGNTQLETLPIKTLDYSFNHIKNTKDKTQNLSISLDVVVKIPIGLKLNIGSVAYSTVYRSQLNTEHIQVNYYKEDYVKRLLPSEEVSSKIHAEYGTNLRNASHIVSELYYGAQLVADIQITNNKTTKMTNKSASGLGAVIIGPISSGIEAGLKALLDKPNDEYKVVVSMECTHDKPPGTGEGGNYTAEDIFSFIKSLDRKDPLPVKAFCVPINLFLEGAPAPPSIPTIPNYFLQPLNDMLTTLTDYIDTDMLPEPFRRNEGKFEQVRLPLASSHFTKMIMQADHRLRIMLDAAENAITAAALKAQGSWNMLANELYGKAKGLVEGIHNTTTEESIIVLLEDYYEKFKLGELKGQIDDFVGKGMEQLRLINADDVNEFTEANFLGSRAALDRMFASRSVGDQITAVLETNQETAGPPPPGLFLAAYNLSSKMDVSILLPNACDKFTLTVSFPGAENMVFTAYEDIMIVFEILSVGFGVGIGVPGGRWYQALASIQTPPIPLPLNEAPSHDSQFHCFFQTVTSKYKNVKIYPTFMSLKSDLMKKKSGDEVTTLCFPTCLHSLTHTVQVFLKLHDKFGSNAGIRFIVGDFELGEAYVDGPLVLVFLGRELKAGVLDHLDYLLLENLLSGPTPDFSILENRACTFYPSRMEYYRELRTLFVFSYVQRPLIVHHNLVLIQGDGEHQKKIVRALEVCGAYLAIEEREVKMANVLTKQLLLCRPSARNQLERITWSTSEQRFTQPNTFGEARRRKARAVFLNLFFSSSAKLLKLGGFYYTLEFCLQAYEARDWRKDLIENEDENKQTLYAVQDHFIDIGALVENKYLSTNFIDIDDKAAKEIEALLVRGDSTPAGYKTYAQKARQAARMLEEKFLLNVKLAGIDDDQDEGILLLQSILSILPPIEDEVLLAEEGFRRAQMRREDSEENFHIIVSTWVKQVDPSKYKEDLDAKLLVKIANTLQQDWYPSWHNRISEVFAKITSLNDYEALVNVVETIGMLKLKLLKEHQFIWSNPPFGTFVLETLNFEDDPLIYSKRIFDAVKMGDMGEDYVSIPPYIPVRVASRLREDHLYNDKKQRKRRAPANLGLLQRSQTDVGIVRRGRGSICV